MTIVFINSTHKWGGVKTWTLDFGDALQRRGHRVEAVVRPATPFVDACRGRGFQVHPLSFGPKYNPLAILRLTWLLRRSRADVAVVNISKDLNVGAMACRLAKVPVVHRVGSIHDYRGSREERFWHEVLVDRVLVPCHYLKRALVEKLGWIHPEKVVVIPNSKDLAVYAPGQRRQRGGTVFGITGQLSAGRGHIHLLRALRELLAGGTPVSLRVAGVGPLDGELRRQAAALGLDAAVEFCGFQEDIPAFLRTLDAFVLPSHSEAFPNTVLEALCAGLPVVASDLEGIREMVGEAGLLVPVADEPALTAAMGALAASPGRRCDLGAAGRRRAEAHFDIRANAGKLEDLFGEVARS